MIQYIVILIVFYLITCMYGLPFQLFLESNHTKRFAAVTCPLYGLSIGMICMYYFNRTGCSVLKIALPLTAAFAVADIFLLKWKRNSFSFDYKKIGISFLIIIVAVLYFASPGVVNNNGNLPILFHNNDFVLYTATSNAVKYHDFSYIRDYYEPLIELTMDIQNRYIDFWIAYVSVIFKVSIFNAASLVSIFLYGMNVAAGAGLMTVFCKNKMAYIVSAILFFFNCNFQYMFYQGFIGQIASVSIIIVITMMFIHILESSEILIKESAAMGILIAGLLSTYGEMIPIVALPMILLLMIYFIIDKSKAKMLFGNFLITTLTVAIVFIRGFYTSIKTLFISNQATVGWDIRPGFLLQSIGIYNVHTIDILDTLELQTTFVVVTGILIWLTICIYVYKRFSGEKRLLTETYLLTYGILYFVFFLHYDLYKTFKAMVTMSYVFIILIFVYLNDKENNSVWYRRLKNTALVIIVLIVTSGGIHMFEWNYSYSEAIKDGEHVFANTIGTEQDELQEFLRDADCSSIYVSVAPYWDDIAALTTTIGVQKKTEDVEQYLWGASDELPDDNAIVIDSSTLPDAVRYYGNTLLKNTVYTVKQADTLYPFCLNREDLGMPVFYGTDAEGYAIGGRSIADQESELKFYIARNHRCDAYLSFICNTSNCITVVMPDGKEQIIQCVPGKNEMQFQNVLFTKGSQNKIKIKVENTDLYLMDLSFDKKDETEACAYRIPDTAKYSRRLPKRIIQSLIKMISKENLLDVNGLDISFMPEGNYKRFVSDGLWEGEEEGLWTKERFQMDIRLKEIRNICIDWDGAAFQEDYRVHLYCNEHDLGYVAVNPDHTLDRVIIRTEVLRKGKNQIRIEIENIVSPNELDLGSDGRLLGIRLKHIKMTLDGV